MSVTAWLQCSAAPRCAERMCRVACRDDLAELRAKYDALLRTVAEKDGTAPSALVVVQHDLETALAVKANLEAVRHPARRRVVARVRVDAQVRDSWCVPAANGGSAEQEHGLGRGACAPP